MVAKKKKKVAATKKTAKGGGESEAGEVEALYLVAEVNEEAMALLSGKGGGKAAASSLDADERADSLRRSVSRATAAALDGVFLLRPRSVPKVSE